MKANVGAFDQWLRFSAGFVLVFLAGTGLIGAWGFIGIALLATAAVRYCPLYHALGCDTLRRDSAGSSGPPDAIRPTHSRREP